MATITVCLYGRLYQARIKRETVKRVLCVVHLKNGRAVETWFRKQYSKLGLGPKCARAKVDFEL